MISLTHWTFSKTAVLLGVAALVGCASPTGYQRPDVQVPAQWQQGAAQGEAALSSSPPWWLVLDDKVLQQLIADALARNNNLAQAAVRVRRAQLVAGQAASEQLPSVRVTGSSSASRQLDGDGTTRQSAVSGAVTWELDLWGRLAALHNAADLGAQASQADQQAAALSLSGTVANLYWQVAYLNQRVEASAQSIDFARQTLKLVEAQYRAGGLSGLEVAQATQSLASQEANHTQWLHQRVQARSALAILFDAPPSLAVNEALRLPDGVLPDVPAGLPASLLTRRPDLRAAELRLRQSAATVDASRSSYYPALTLTSSIGGSSTALSHVLSDPVGTLGAGLVLPFVQWRDMQRSVAIAQADDEVAVLGFRQSWYQALSEVEIALSARMQYEAQGVRLAQALSAAQTAERLSEARYRAGSVTLKIWLDAQEARRQVENSLAQNRLSRLNALVVLYQALGGNAAEP
ncbi:MAG: efflux transporter outer membrane subunit [Aquabacterium sp.]|nr:efflux transporter outer membrane subunit [Aquabacterium sp.]